MKVFFVVGAARSGTTLLTRLLSAHERIHLHHERRVLEIAGVAGGLLRTGGRPIDEHPAPDVLARDLARGRGFAEAVLRADAAEGTVWFGDKYPPYAGQIPLLARVWPQARFIHIVRDGRGVASSWLTAWARDRAWRRALMPPSLDEIAASWARSVDLADEAGEKLGPDRYLAFRYEDLLSAPRETGARLLAILGEAPTPAFTEALAQVEVRGDWQKDLSAAEGAAVADQPQARDTLARWGYPPGPADPTPDTVEGTLAEARAATSADAARTAWLRLLRLRPGHREACIALMALAPRRGEALWALQHLGRTYGPEAREAVRALLVARGLEADAAAALLEAPA